MKRCVIIQFLSFFIFSLVSAQPKLPVEPKAPSVDEKADANAPKPMPQDRAGREYQVLVVFINGSKIRGTIVLKDEKLSASCFCGNAGCFLSEAMGQIKSIEFTNWKVDGPSRRFRHSHTAIILRDGSKFKCERIPVFDRFSLKREGKTLWCYTLYYGKISHKPRSGKKKTNKQYNVKLQSDDLGQVKIEPHPDAVRKIEFLREEGESLIDLIPFMMK